MSPFEQALADLVEAAVEKAFTKALAAAQPHVLSSLNAMTASKALRASKAQDDVLITTGEVMELAPGRRDHVRKAVLGGGLVPAVENFNARGRTARYLFSKSSVMAWLRAGRPTTAVKS